MGRFLLAEILGVALLATLVWYGAKHWLLPRLFGSAEKKSVGKK
jgi:hypothetical protein